MPTLSVKVVNSQWPTFGLEFDVVFKIVDLSALRIPITPISAIIFNSNILTQVYLFLKNIGFLIILVKKKKNTSYLDILVHYLIIEWVQFCPYQDQYHIAGTNHSFLPQTLNINHIVSSYHLENHKSLLFHIIC